MGWESVCCDSAYFNSRGSIAVAVFAHESRKSVPINKIAGLWQDNSDDRKGYASVVIYSAINFTDSVKVCLICRHHYTPLPEHLQCTSFVRFSMEKFIRRLKGNSHKLHSVRNNKIKIGNCRFEKRAIYLHGNKCSFSRHCSLLNLTSI